MNTTKRIGRTVGFLFLLMILFGMPGTMFRGISTAMTETPGFLNDIYQALTQMRLAITMDVLGTVMGMIIAIVVYPVLKAHYPKFAIAYICFWAIQMVMVLISDINHFMLLSLSERFVETGSENGQYFEVVGFSLVKGYLWAHLMALLVYGSGGSLFYYHLMQARLIPKFLGIWGIIALSIVFFTTWAQVFGVKVSFNLYLQNGLHFITFTGWLLIKGFNGRTEQEAIPGVKHAEPSLT